MKRMNEMKKNIYERRNIAVIRGTLNWKYCVQFPSDTANCWSG